MTIKIITKGVDPKTTPLRGTCSNCRTEVECTQQDATPTESSDQRDFGSFHVKCPVCSASIYMRKYVPHDGRGPG